ncbi:MAG TPA: aminoglycoside adenylyltransferase domain-containing protein, partial [Gaiellaceae bacterium]|nr:aminoglycoside adenylyltransferase domain-containing protein [Gaiellaceae bacterium]
PHAGHPSGMSRWKQPYVVLTLCRALHTLETGTVCSKREAGEWAKRALDPEWRDLIQQALDDRPDPWGRTKQDSTPILVARTRAFADAVAVSV